MSHPGPSWILALWLGQYIMLFLCTQYNFVICGRSEFFSNYSNKASCYYIAEWLREWLLFNVKWVIFQPYYGENKLHFHSDSYQYDFYHQIHFFSSCLWYDWSTHFFCTLYNFVTIRIYKLTDDVDSAQVEYYPSLKQQDWIVT